MMTSFHPQQAWRAVRWRGCPTKTPSSSWRRACPPNCLFTCLAAVRDGQQPTGHGFPVPNEIGEARMNIVIGAAPTIARMIAETRAGHSGHATLVHPRSGPFRKIMTGMTRDGTFLVEGGEIVSGLTTSVSTKASSMLNQCRKHVPAERAIPARRRSTWSSLPC
jgi:hypothetical protein